MFPVLWSQPGEGKPRTVPALEYNSVLGEWLNASETEFLLLSKANSEWKQVLANINVIKQ